MKMAKEKDFEEVQLLLINPVVANVPNYPGLTQGFSHAIVKNKALGLEITQIDRDNQPQTLFLHTSQLEKLKEAIEMKLEIGVGNGD